MRPRLPLFLCKILPTIIPAKSIQNIPSHDRTNRFLRVVLLVNLHGKKKQVKRTSSS